MAALAQASIHVAFFSPHGQFLARVEGLPGGNVLLRRAQFRIADDTAKSLEIARAIVAGKIENARQHLLHAKRDADEARAEAFESAAKRLKLRLQGLAGAATIDEVRGAEGLAAREYFEVFSLFVKRSEGDFQFQGRSRRPPRDRINSLLSFLYVLLLNDCAAAAAGVGLDPAVGYLHEERPGRLSLALDLMEELRAPVADRLALSLINRAQLQPADFKEEPGGAWRLTDAGRKTVLVAYQEAKQVEITHPFLGQTVPWGRVPHLQALLLARLLRGDLDAYPPFLVR
jgi:CRISPR-associated protein Cas1